MHVLQYKIIQVCWEAVHRLLLKVNKLRYKASQVHSRVTSDIVIGRWSRKCCPPPPKKGLTLKKPLAWRPLPPPLVLPPTFCRVTFCFFTTPALNKLYYQLGSHVPRLACHPLCSELLPTHHSTAHGWHMLSLYLRWRPCQGDAHAPMTLIYISPVPLKSR